MASVPISTPLGFAATASSSARSRSLKPAPPRFHFHSPLSPFPISLLLLSNVFNLLLLLPETWSIPTPRLMSRVSIPRYLNRKKTSQKVQSGSQFAFEAQRTSTSFF
ncbi:hypothetical protein GW17_00039525 [Ensete ventricosum]|nr:hypothetical protein GW17_00039525 [Ensete ventricosum]